MKDYREIVSNINKMYKGAYVRIVPYWSFDLKITDIEVITLQSMKSAKEVKECLRKLKKCYKFIKKLGGTK